MTEAEQKMIEVAILMAQELQEYVDEARESSGDDYGKWISGAADQREMDKLGVMG